MRPFLPLLALCLSLAALAGCAGDEADVTVESSSQALTDKPKDALFTLKLDKAPDPYDLSSLVVKAKAKDKDAATLACAAADTNTNQKLDVGETLTCLEGEANVFDASHAGKEIEVEVFRSVSGKEERIATATWTPK